MCQHSRIPNSIQFRVLCHTHFGQQLRICGNTKELGDWNPLSAHKLVTDPSTYPVWKSIFPIPILNPSTIQFKACIIANNTITWERNIENRKLLSLHPSILEFSFNQSHLNITQKKVTEIQCRQGTWNILREMQGSESSIEFKSNYPIESYFMYSRDSLQMTKQLSYSQLSSNLYSPSKNCDDLPGKSNSINEFDSYTVKHYGTRQCIKSKSIRPHLIRKFDEISMTLDVENIITKRKRSRSRSLERSDSSNRKKNQQPSSPYLIHVPSIQHIQDKPKSIFHQQPDEFVDEVIQSKTQKQISQKVIENVCKSIKEFIFPKIYHTEDNKSTSTVTEFQTEDQYFTTRQCDVVIENISSFDDI